MTYEEFAEQFNLQIKATALPFRLDSASDWDKDMIHFAVEITDKDSTRIWHGQYSVGFEYPEVWANNKPLYAGHLAAIKKAPKSIGAEYSRLALRAAYERAAPLDLADVLESLQCDISGTDQPFEDWASDLGYDADSRKTFAIYEERLKTRNQLFAALGHQALATLLECEYA